MNFAFERVIFTHSEQDKSPRRPDGQVGLVGYFLDMSGCKYTYMKTRRFCVAKGNESKKTRPAKVQKTKSFTIL